MTPAKGLDALLATAHGRDFLLSNGIHAEPATFRAAISPPRDSRLSRAGGFGQGPFVHMHQQIYLDYRPSVMAKVLALDSLVSTGIDPAFLWIDTDRAASDKLACRFYWPFDGALRPMKITPPGSDALETRFARVDPARTDAAYRRIAAYVRDGRVEGTSRAEQLTRLSSLRAHMVISDPMPLRDYGLGMTRALFAAHLGIDHPYVIVSDMLAKGWLTSAIEDVLNMLTGLISTWNAQVLSLQADGIATAVGLLPDDYLPLYVSDPRDGARLRLRHQKVGADHFATAQAKDGRTHRFFLGTRRLRLDEVAATERWSPDVILPMLTNALFSGWVAGRSSALYALVLNKVLTDVLGERPSPILVPDCAAGHGGDPDAAAASLLHAYVTSTALSGHRAAPRADA